MTKPELVKRYKLMKHLCKATDEVYAALLMNISQCKTEKGAARFINKQFRLRGVKPAFRTIVANCSAEIHHWPTKKRLQRGFVIVDIGARKNGLSCDMSRTFFIGRPNARERKLYDAVRSCQALCCKKVRAGAWANEIDDYARQLLGKYKKYFVHSLGHGVGEKIHQPPWFRARQPCKIRHGDFVTIEPGIYINGKSPMGIRIEDTLHVGKKVEILTKSAKKLVCADG